MWPIRAVLKTLLDDRSRESRVKNERTFRRMNKLRLLTIADANSSESSSGAIENMFILHICEPAGHQSYYVESASMEMETGKSA